MVESLISKAKKRPSTTGLLLFIFPYLILSFYGLISDNQLYSNLVIISSCACLGFIAFGSFSYERKLLDLYREIKPNIVEEDEGITWKESLDLNLSKTTPFKVGAILSTVALLPHYFVFHKIIGREVYFLSEFDFITYLLVWLFIWIPAGIFAIYLFWIVLAQHFWVFGFNPVEHPIKLGKKPQGILRKLFSLEGFVQPMMYFKLIVPKNEFGPFLNLAVFGSIVVGIGGAIALVGIYSTEASLSEMPISKLSIMFAIILYVIASFAYPLKKIHETIARIKAEKLEKIDARLTEKIIELERRLSISSNLEGTEGLNNEINALQILSTRYRSVKTFPVEPMMIVKMISPLLALISNFLKFFKFPLTMLGL